MKFQKAPFFSERKVNFCDLESPVPSILNLTALRFSLSEFAKSLYEAYSIHEWNYLSALQQHFEIQFYNLITYDSPVHPMCSKPEGIMDTPYRA